MKEKRKVIVAIVLFVAVAIIIVACGYISTNKDKETGSTPSEAPSAASTAAPTEAPATDTVSEAPTSDTETTAAPAETEAPTEVPTNVPETAAPETETPTAEPTAAPTAVPATATPTAVPTVAPTAAPTAVPTAAPTEVPTAVPATVAPTAVPTAAPTAVPTAAPTAAPTSQYPWSAEVTEYLTDENRSWYLRNNSSFGTSGNEYDSVRGTIFGNCAKSTNGGINYDDDFTHYETVNKDGVIAQTYVTRYFDQGLFEWVDNVKIVTGVYLDVDYVKPGAVLKTEPTFDESPWLGVFKTEVFGVEITRMQPLRSDLACNYYPLISGEFVLDIGGHAIILNKIPESVSIMFGRGDLQGFNGFQVGVNGHVVFEAESFGTSDAHRIPDWVEKSTLE